MAVTGATLGRSMKTFKAKNRSFASAVKHITKGEEAVKAGKAPAFKGDVKGASKFYRKKDVAATRAEVTRPKKTPSVQETGRIKHPQNAWKQPQLHQTSNWSKQKSSAEIGNYMAWKYSGFKKGY